MSNCYHNTIGGALPIFLALSLLMESFGTTFNPMQDIYALIILFDLIHLGPSAKFQTLNSGTEPNPILYPHVHRE